MNDLYEKISNYSINTKTMMIYPQVDPHQCLVYEVDEVYLCDATSFKIVNDSCMDRGTTLEGRRQAVKSILENKHKPPIPIDTERGIIFLPTKVIKDYECAWISYNHLQHVEQHQTDPNRSVLTFTNGVAVEVMACKKQITKQMTMAGHVFGHFKKGSFLD